MLCQKSSSDRIPGRETRIKICEGCNFWTDTDILLGMICQGLYSRTNPLKRCKVRNSWRCLRFQGRGKFQRKNGWQIKLDTQIHQSILWLLHWLVNAFPNLQHSNFEQKIHQLYKIWKFIVMSALTETCMQTCFAWMVVIATMIGLFSSFISKFPFKIHLLQSMREILDDKNRNVRLRAKLKWHRSSTVLTKEMSPGRSPPTWGNPTHSPTP